MSKTYISNRAGHVAGFAMRFPRTLRTKKLWHKMLDELADVETVLPKTLPYKWRNAPTSWDDIYARALCVDTKGRLLAKHGLYAYRHRERLSSGVQFKRIVATRVDCCQGLIKFDSRWQLVAMSTAQPGWATYELRHRTPDLPKGWVTNIATGATISHSDLI